jgi:hypothetical protein
MQEHLRLSFSSSEASDDQVLAMYPSTLRRRILRHLYLPLLRSSYLFSGTPRKFLVRTYLNSISSIRLRRLEHSFFCPYTHQPANQRQPTSIN